MKNKFLKAGVIAIVAIQPLLAGAAATPGSDIGAAYAGRDGTPATTPHVSALLVAQNQGQGGNQNSNANQNESQNQNQNENRNENRNQNDNRNRNRSEDAPAALAKATEQAILQPNYACFYEFPAFKGARFCAEPGDQATSSPAGWNDRISSIEIVGKVKVRVCTDADFTGTCRIFTASENALPKGLDDAISSWNVE